MTLSDFRDLLLQVGITVFHYSVELNECPYIVFQEFATTYDFASNKAYTEKTSVEVIHFTKTEFDPTFDLLKKILIENSIFFSVATTFDKDNKIIQNQLDVVLIHDYAG